MDLIKFLIFIKSIITDKTFLFVLSTVSGIILFSKFDFITNSKIIRKNSEYRDWVYVIFIFSSIGFLTQVIIEIYKYVEKKIHDKRLQDRMQQQLNNLTNDEFKILSSYIKQNTKTQYLRMEDGVVNGLVQAHIIYRSSNLGDSVKHTWPYNVQPWVWDYLYKHPEILAQEKK